MAGKGRPVAKKGAAIKTLLIEGHGIIRSALKTLLERERGVRVVAEAGSLAGSLELLRRIDCDLVISETVFGDGELSRFLRQLGELGKAPPVLVLTHRTEEQVILKALQSGARGVLSKAASAEDLFRAIDEVLCGNSYLDPCFAHYVLAELRQVEPATDGRFSSREIRILEMASQGHPNARIAEELNVSVSTVKSQFQSVYRRLGVTDRTLAVVRALQAGIISVPGLSVDGG